MRKVSSSRRGGAPTQRLNNEGITMADDSAWADGKKPFFWSDASATEAMRCA